MRFSLITPLQGERGRRENAKLASKEEKLRLGDSFGKRISKLQMGRNKVYFQRAISDKFSDKVIVNGNVF